MDILITMGVFILTVLAIEGGYFSILTLRNSEKKKVRRRLRTLSAGGQHQDETVDIVRKKMLSNVPWLNRLLLNSRWSERMHCLLEQADAKHTLGVYILLTIFLIFAGLLGGSLVKANYLIRLPLAALLGAVPFFSLYLKKKKRMEKFERQLPEALDLIARGLKAGHAFSGGLMLVGDEMGDPVGTEFIKTLDQVNFGVGIPEALKGLARRVDCPDLNFFVLAVILQRETGGNLAEILQNIAYLIRERFKLQGRVRTLSAEGRLSAAILTALPFFLGFVISIINPVYLKILTTDAIGHVLIFLAVIMMAVGIFVMKRMIKINV